MNIKGFFTCDANITAKIDWFYCRKWASLKRLFASSFKNTSKYTTTNEKEPQNIKSLTWTNVTISFQYVTKCQANIHVKASTHNHGPLETMLTTIRAQGLASRGNEIFCFACHTMASSLLSSHLSVSLLMRIHTEDWHFTLYDCCQARNGSYLTFNAHSTSKVIPERNKMYQITSTSLFTVELYYVAYITLETDIKNISIKKIVTEPWRQ